MTVLATEAEYLSSKYEVLRDEEKMCEVSLTVVNTSHSFFNTTQENPVMNIEKLFL